MILLLVVSILLFGGCRTYNKEETASELAYEILEPDEIPEELQRKIESKKASHFQITYEEDGLLYIGQGYGEKEQEGYEIRVDQCQSSAHFVYFHTILIGPEKAANDTNASYPYLVVRCKEQGKQVIFE